MSSTVFSSLISEYKTWTALSAYLTSDAGGSLRVYDRSTPENPFALVRYVKGKSDLSKPHVRAFRSVVWDTLENRPVSVTPFKSEDGESLPETESTAGFAVERFVDGVMIGAFFDRYADHWRIHTRSSLDANTRYYSQDKTFRQMFFQAAPPDTWLYLNKELSYTWMLQHPENRIVVPVSRPTVTLIQAVLVQSDCAVTINSNVPTHLKVQAEFSTWTDVRARLSDWNTQFKHGAQGLVVKELATGKRWKVRTAEYNRVRQLRGNTARRDYLWLTMWRAGNLRDYLALFPEERGPSNNLIERFKRVTSDVFHFYTDVFKARTLQKTAIPPKYRPFVYGLHSLFMETLKPAGKTVVWKTAQDYMNGRDVAQMLFVLNWDVRQTQKLSGAREIPLEPAVAQGTEVQEPRRRIVGTRRMYGEDEPIYEGEEDDDLPPLVAMDAVPAAPAQFQVPAGGE